MGQRPKEYGQHDGPQKDWSSSQIAEDVRQYRGPSPGNSAQGRSRYPMGRRHPILARSNADLVPKETNGLPPPWSAEPGAWAESPRMGTCGAGAVQEMAIRRGLAERRVFARHDAPGGGAP